MPFFFLLILANGCATSSSEKQLKAWETWNERPSSELGEHPYFKTLKVTKLKHDNAPETWIYKDQTPVQTGAYCQSLGGCIGMPIYNCEHAFSVKNDVIIGYEQAGTCPDLKTIEAKNK